MNKQEKSKQGKRNKVNGAKFENLVRKDLELKGWIVAKWTNNVSGVFEQDIGEYVRILEPAKHKFNPYSKIMSIGNGFPDFVAFTLGISREDIDLKEPGNLMLNEDKDLNSDRYYIIGVEAKTNGYLDKEERAKCKWLLDKQIFSKILIASKNGKEIKYKEFEK